MAAPHSIRLRSSDPNKVYPPDPPFAPGGGAGGFQNPPGPPSPAPIFEPGGSEALPPAYDPGGSGPAPYPYMPTPSGGGSVQPSALSSILSQAAVPTPPPRPAGLGGTAPAAAAPLGGAGGPFTTLSLDPTAKNPPIYTALDLSKLFGR